MRQAGLDEAAEGTERRGKMTELKSKMTELKSKMNELSKKKFQVKVTKVYKAWSFAIGLSNSDDETYILINFYKWSIAIGRLYEYTTD